MNIVNRWLDNRRERKQAKAIAKNYRAEVKRKAEEAERQQKCETLRGHVKDISDDLERIGFKTNQRYATGDQYDQATLVVVGPDGTVHNLTVFQRGGYRLSK